MKTATRQKALRSAAGIVLAVVMIFLKGATLPLVDGPTDDYFGRSITTAGLAYATCRTINASVSVVKHSTLQLEPAGIGLSLAVGQVLDPIDDMTERLSDVMVTAITSLGVQKLAYAIGVAFVPPILAACLFLLALLTWYENRRVAALRAFTLQLILVVAVFRFCLPVSSLANTVVQAQFFEPRIAEAREQLSLGSAEIDALGDLSLPQVDGLMGTIENSTAFLKKKSAAFKDAMVYTVENMGRIVDNLLNLTFLYVGIFVVQVVVLPLASFWLLVRTANLLLRQNAVP